MKILLVEDNPGDAMLVREYLSDVDPNIELIHKTSLQDSAKVLQDTNIDAILLDLSLPDAQGLETVHRARQLAPHHPIVVFSGISDRETAVMALQNGAQDFLVKGQGNGDDILRALKYAIERAELLQKLEQSNLRLEISSGLALHAARMVSWDWRLEDDSLTMSKNATEVLGENAIWTTFGMRNQDIHREDVKPYLEVIRRAQQSKKPYHASSRFWNQSSHGYIWVEEYGMARLNIKGEVIAINGVTQDITERKIADLTLRRILEAQKRFVGDAAHELRAPLTSIQGNLELLRRYPNMPETDRKETTEDAYREAARLGRLVNDLLALARGDAGEGLRLEPIQLHALVGESIRHAQHLTKNHQLELDKLTQCTVEADHDRLQQLMLILLDNAIKYTPDGGLIRVSLDCDPDWAEIQVQDTGVGIAPENIEQVFERFYRVDKGRSRGTDPGGTGLGLPIAKWIVAQHGGEIRLESTVGVGTLAIVRLKIASPNDESVNAMQSV
jgi:signal transduction histidine kinase/DNA-binding response OmpR family regulator